MATQLNISIPNCNVPLSAGLRMLTLADDWRRDLHALEGRRIERDRIALRRLHATPFGSDVSAGVVDLSQMLQDYLASSVSIAQDSIGMTMRHQEAFVSAVGGAWNDWRLGWLGCWDRLPGADAGNAMHEWKRLFERSLADMGVSAALRDGDEARSHGSTRSNPRAAATREVQYES